MPLHHILISCSFLEKLSRVEEYEHSRHTPKKFREYFYCSQCTVSVQQQKMRRNKTAVHRLVKDQKGGDTIVVAYLLQV